MLLPVFPTQVGSPGAWAKRMNLHIQEKNGLKTRGTELHMDNVCKAGRHCAATRVSNLAYRIRKHDLLVRHENGLKTRGTKLHMGNGCEANRCSAVTRVSNPGGQPRS